MRYVKCELNTKKLVYFVTAIGLLMLAACNGVGNAVPTTVQPASIPNSVATVQLPATLMIATSTVEAVLGTVSPQETPVIQAGEVISGDDFLPIDEILSEIDNDVCQDAYQTKAELEALIAEGADVAELESAVEELIQELENCPTPTPAP